MDLCEISEQFMSRKNSLKAMLDHYWHEIGMEFIDQDPIAIPHRYHDRRDQEIAGFFAAIFAWGRRSVILQKSNELLGLMEHEPYEFVKAYSRKDQSKILNFKHRTFNGQDLDFYLRFLNYHFKDSDTMESLFQGESDASHVESRLTAFYDRVFRFDSNEKHALKHISSPAKKSACKRLCLYLRWMVRCDEIDLGLWKSIRPDQLIIPLDVHVMNISKKYKLVKADAKPCWETAVALTEKLKEFDRSDPVKYDLVLFNLGVEKKEIAI